MTNLTGVCLQRPEWRPGRARVQRRPRSPGGDGGRLEDSLRREPSARLLLPRGDENDSLDCPRDAGAGRGPSGAALGDGRLR